MPGGISKTIYTLQHEDFSVVKEMREFPTLKENPDGNDPPCSSRWGLAGRMMMCADRLGALSGPSVRPSGVRILQPRVSYDGRPGRLKEEGTFLIS